MSRVTLCSVALLGFAALSGCAQEPVRFRVRSFGAMREVLHDGRSHGRVRLSEVVNDDTVAVGVSEALRAEITVDRGEVYLTSVVDGRPVTSESVGLARAALLLSSDVSRWSSFKLPEIRTLSQLEDEVKRRASETGLAPGAHGVPFRVEGDFPSISFHVVDGACPVANPDGPPPWRWSSGAATGRLIGIYVEGQAGRMTHHNSRSHVHAVVDAPKSIGGDVVSGHLEAVSIEAGSRLYLPVGH